jgi:hypothetical protein
VTLRALLYSHSVRRVAGGNLGREWLDFDLLPFAPAGIFLFKEDNMQTGFARSLNLTAIAAGRLRSRLSPCVR